MSWIAEDGLMRLDPQDDREGFNGYPLRTVNNNNGILERTLYEILCAKIGLLRNREPWIETVLRLEHPQVPGFYCRHPGQVDAEEAQDNGAAICAGSVLFDARTVARRRHQQLTEKGWEVRAKDEKWSVKQQLQGGEEAYSAICCGWRPSPWTWMWFLLGILVNAFSGKPVNHNHVSDARLTWLRLWAVDWMFLTPGQTYQPWVRPTFWIVKAIWNWRTRKKYGHELQPIALYYHHEGNPNKRMALYLMGARETP